MNEDYGRAYAALYARHWWWRAREMAILDQLRAIRSPHGFGNILDVGCGDALFFDKLQAFGEVEGIEASKDLLDPHGKHRNRIHVAPFDAHFQPGRRYGLVLMLDVLEHMDDPVAALRHAISLSAPGGKIVLTVPAFNLLWTAHDDMNHHRNRYTASSFAQVSGKAGLRIETIRYLFQWTFPVKLAQRSLEKLLGLRNPVPFIPPAPINRALYLWSRAEQKIFAHVPVPFGSSLLIVGSGERA